MGQALGTYATLNELRRVRAGSYHLTEAVSVEDLKKFSLEQLEKQIFPLSSFPAYAFLGRASS